MRTYTKLSQVGWAGISEPSVDWNSSIRPLTVIVDRNLNMVQVGVAGFRQQYSANFNHVLAVATVAAVPTLVIFFVFRRQIAESIKTLGLNQASAPRRPSTPGPLRSADPTSPGSVRTTDRGFGHRRAGWW